MKKVFKTKTFKIIAGIVVAFFVLCIGSAMGSSDAKSNIGKETVTYVDLLNKVDSAKSKLKDENNQLADAQMTIAQGESAKKELNDAEAKLKDAQAELDKKLADGQKDIDAKLADANKQLSNNQAKANDLQSQVDAKQKELDSLTGQVVKASGAPKRLSSGQYVVGKDIPAGRYTVHALGSGSNFFVYDGSDGSAKVNTILGNADGLGSGDYTFFCSDKDIIETHEPVQLTPVQ